MKVLAWILLVVVIFGVAFIPVCAEDLGINTRSYFSACSTPDVAIDLPHCLSSARPVEEFSSEFPATKYAFSDGVGIKSSGLSGSKTVLDATDQPQPPAHTNNVFVSAGDNLWTGVKNTFGNPYYLSIIGASFALDQPMRKWVVKSWFPDYRRNDFTHSINRVESVGSSPVAVGVLSYGLLFGNKTATGMGLNIAEATLAANLAYIAINFSTGRKSPLYTGQAFDFSPFDVSTGKEQVSSIFPSGHVLHVAPMVGVAATYLNHPIADVAGYSLIVWMAAQRINKNVHWTSDTVVSGFLGYQIGRAFAHWQMAGAAPAIAPSVTNDISGAPLISLQWKLKW